MLAGNEDLKANDAIYFEIDNSALRATWQVGKKDSVMIEKVQPPELAVQFPSPHNTLAYTFHSPHNISAPELAVLILSGSSDERQSPSTSSRKSDAFFFLPTRERAQTQ